jgi:hypothetical protein
MIAIIQNILPFLFADILPMLPSDFNGVGFSTITIEKRFVTDV